jgi:hypothetical protein
MMITKRFTIWAAALGAALLVTAVRPGGISAEEGEQDARGWHKQGVEAFKEGNYDDASRAFREAQKLRPTWKLNYNIGQCEAAAKRYGLALEAFEAYLVGGGDDVPDERREYVSAEIRRIQPLVGVLEVEAPPGVEVLVDGALRGVLPLAGPLRVAAGPHAVQFDKEGERLYEQKINVAGGMTSLVTLPGEESSVPPEKREPVEEQAAADEVPSGRSPLWGVGWAAFGVGAAVAIGGAITGGLALGKSNDLADSCPDKESCPEKYSDLPEEADRLALATNILLPVGSVLAVTGIVLVIVGRGGGKEKGDRAGLEVAPIAGPSLTGLSLGGRF